MECGHSALNQTHEIEAQMTTDPRIPDNGVVGTRVLRWVRQREMWGPKIAGSVCLDGSPETPSQLIAGGFLTEDLGLTDLGRRVLAVSD